ncbi:MAG: Two-component transcriptional response regulator, NarL/FixJ family [Nitrospira sp.]|jgi:signal transduction histidine kinase/ActR/RegA family two-component response regulator|nr:MAG: Two-component transcriptional response regulator, NarL/FixJ family [Nitrospira sp.]
MKTVADQVAIAMQRKQGEEALRRSEERFRIFAEQLEQLVAERTEELTLSQERLRALASELNLTEQRERKRLATELHDHLQQMLVVGKLTVGQGKRLASGVPECETVLKRVEDILSDALAYSRTLVAELSPPVLRDHGLAAALKWLAEYMKKKHEQNVTVIVPEGDWFQLPEDQRVLLFQSVRELLINASKHAGTGTVTVRMTQREDQIQIEVCDEGRGFDLAAAARIPSGGISSKFGLYSIQERMRALGGSFDITSALGRGTTATLTLPLGKPSVADGMVDGEWLMKDGKRTSVSSDHSPLNIDHSHRRRSVRVLLADDHAMVRQGLRAVLDAYEDIQVVGEAGDGAEALRLVEESQPRVLVMDINMPKMNGIEATTRIKAHWPGIAVVGISVNAGDENSDVMKRAGAATVLPKDTAVEQLHAAIIEAVDSVDQ